MQNISYFYKLINFFRLSVVDTSGQYWLVPNTAVNSINYVDASGSFIIPASSQVFSISHFLLLLQNFTYICLFILKLVQNTTITISTLDDNTFGKGETRTFSLALGSPVNGVLPSTNYQLRVKDTDSGI